jgi:hypothetical protein
VPIATALGLTAALRIGDRVEAAAIAGDDQIVLRIEMVVEAALGDVQFGRDLLH